MRRSSLQTARSAICQRCSPLAIRRKQDVDDGGDVCLAERSICLPPNRIQFVQSVGAVVCRQDDVDQHQPLPAWLDQDYLRDGQQVIAERAAEETLAARYHLDEEGVSVATAAIYILGVLLIGGGVISLVAWNWEALGRFAKLALILALEHVLANRFYRKQE